MVLSMNNFDTDAKVELTNSKFSFRSNASFTYNYLFTKQQKEVFSTGRTRDLVNAFKGKQIFKIETERGRRNFSTFILVSVHSETFANSRVFEQISDIGHL